MAPPDRPGPPRDEVALIQRADAMVGHSLGSIAAGLGIPVPPHLRRHKGWIGDLAEAALGADPKAGAGPDFPDLGIELKTVPLAPSGRPKESTWVCACPMDTPVLGPWEGSPVQAKLAQVLWLPILGDGPPANRTVGVPLLWSPSFEQETVLRHDWTVLSELVGEGEVWQWTAHHGEALQLRPKAAKSANWVWVTDQEGEWVRTTPLGFYLRARFTAGVLAAEGAG